MYEVGNLGGYGRALLRHLQRRGPQSRDELLDHFVDGAHGWHPETLDGAIGELVAVGYLTPADQAGVYRLTAEPRV